MKGVRQFQTRRFNMAKTNVKRIRGSLEFVSQAGPVLIASASPVADGFIANPTIYPAPPVDGATLKTQITTYSTAYTANVNDGGKKTLTEKNKQEHALKEMLRKDVHYAEACCNQDMATFMLSGFKAATIGPVAPLPVDIPIIKTVNHGNPGELSVSVKKVANAKIYQVQFGVSVNGAAPGTWTNITLPNSKPATIPSLTAGTAYQFQARAYGALGWSAWSDPITRMCV
jgi:hypothetical protein